MNKNTLRQKFSAIETDWSKDQIIFDKALSFVEKYRPRIVGIYIAQIKEIDLVSMLLKCKNTIFAAPKILANESVVFTNYHMGSKLIPNEKYASYFEPESDKEVVPDLIFVPGVAFDTKGYRLGMGKGHYDKYLVDHKAVKIGVCRSVNLVTRLPEEPHDVRMDHVITEDVILNLV